GPATYTYTVRAVDDAGNVSPDSNAAAAQVSQPSTPVFQDGFETGNLSRWTASSGMVVQGQEVYRGSFAARATSNGQPSYASDQLPATAAELYYDAHFKLFAQSTQAPLLRFETATGVPLVTVFASVLARIGYRNERNGATAVGASAVTAGWHDL